MSEETTKEKYIVLQILSKILNFLVTVIKYVSKGVDTFMFIIGQPFESIMNGVGGPAPLSYLYLVGLGFLVAFLYGIIRWVINKIFSDTPMCALSHNIYVTSIVSWLILLWLFAVFAR
jgi:hypothetical protein